MEAFVYGIGRTFDVVPSKANDMKECILPMLLRRSLFMRKASLRMHFRAGQMNGFVVLMELGN